MTLFVLQICRESHPSTQFPARHALSRDEQTQGNSSSRIIC